MFHFEGGWPKEIEASEAQDTLKWRKRVEKDPLYTNAVKALIKQTVACIEQNNTIDLFEHYFLEEEPDYLPQNLNMKTLALFKDPADEKRSVTKISWHPEGPTRIVGSYSTLRFQSMTEDMPMASFIWDISERNSPLMELRSHSPLVSCAYNHRTADWLAGGCYNGILNWYDLKRGPTPCMKSSVEVSHYDPVYDVVWLQSKTGQECASVASDGRLLFWDVRKLSEYMDECVLTDGGQKGEEKTIGGCSLEWMVDAGPTKFLVGTEHGITLSCQKKPKKNCEIGTWFGAENRGGYGRHFGPVYAVKRNPFHVKYFLTVGDWCAKMWMEELKGPMLKTPYYPAFLSSATWSPTRPGVFYLTRRDGYVDVWDYYYRMNEVSLSQKISDAALTSVSISGQNLMAVGDADGVITLMELCDALVQIAPNEKNALLQIFDRETKREKNLEAIKKLGGKKEKVEGGAANISIDESEYKAREKAFFNEVGMTGDDLGTTLGSAPLKG